MNQKVKKVTAVFDIGKTNKKFFLFDKNLNEVHKEYTSFEEIEDEDKYPTENLPSLKKWLKQVFDGILEKKEFKVEAINFSTYGASLVHIDENGNPLTPLYNYAKPLPEAIIQSFFKKYGPKEAFLKSTGCVDLSMLNSGLQLYWLKHTKPEIYAKIKWSLHLPQYLSYVFTGIPISEYTSIGCHTALWDFNKKDYHDWVYKEEIDRILPPIVSTETSINMNYNGNRIKIGVGIHDSSAALLPYIRSIKKKFVLVSTGTWSIVFNPFAADQFEGKAFSSDTINYMRINGKPVMATRVFLGNEYKLQVEKLNKYFNVNDEYHRNVSFNYDTYLEIIRDFKYCFKWESIVDDNMPEKTNFSFDKYEHAYHQLMTELVIIQIKYIREALGENRIARIYVDGGFSNNDIYIKLLSHKFNHKRLSTTDASLGSALGAAISISDKKLNSKFLKRNYALKKHVPFIVNG
ncbi:MAG: FGGY family carbohydrate kinase [Algibacter sp.]|uniref:FGGY-family carbohydrate kinase n=1 Tax=Algibacter sp. TaxID=1872428 RepID=UPI002608E4AC|nr:FGGY family carbohydrate kinase [Algibacter sp.]MDG1729313.1 FGGY family carbohydrate kinase [Algibacter sp.]MDG2179032.1 FGGY family carbohydrate kinase [Algibacter sp.]